MSSVTSAVLAFADSRKAFYVYILFAAAFLGLQSLQGLSWLDIGMYMSGSLHFGDDPYAAYYLGQWYLTYRLSAALCSLFGIFSFPGLRLMHLVLNLILQTAVYAYLGKFVERRYIIAGLLLATLSHFGSYTDINYNDYSTFALMLAVMSYYSGLRRARGGLWLIALSGLLSGVAVFFRIVNLTFLLLPAVPLLTGAWRGLRHGALMQTGCFAAGAAAGCAAVVAAAVADGTAGVLALTFSDIAGIGSDGSDPHNLKSIAISAYTVYKQEIAGFSVIALLAAAAGVAARRLVGIVRRAVSLGLAALIVLNIYFWEPPSNITVGICLAGLTVTLAAGRRASVPSGLFAFAMFIPVVYPVGSNGGAAFFGPWLCWLPLPLAVKALCADGRRLSGKYAAAYGHALRLSYAAVCAAMLFTNVKRPMMEDGNRLECLYTIDSPVTGGIRTAKANADLHNRMIKEAGPLIPDGSYLICNFSTPLVPILGCKPYAVFSDVFTSDRMNERYIRVAYRRAGRGGELPWLLFDTESMTPGFCHVRDVLAGIRPYRRVWSDGRYELLCPVAENNAGR